MLQEQLGTKTPSWTPASMFSKGRCRFAFPINVCSRSSWPALRCISFPLHDLQAPPPTPGSRQRHQSRSTDPPIREIVASSPGFPLRRQWFSHFSRKGEVLSKPNLGFHPLNLEILYSSLWNNSSYGNQVSVSLSNHCSFYNIDTLGFHMKYFHWEPLLLWNQAYHNKT